MGSVGSKSNPDEFNGALGKRSLTSTTFSDTINLAVNNEINPNYGKGDQLYHTNCALCVTAMALQFRGYDVEAMPRDTKTWRGFDTVFRADYTNPDNFILHGGGHGYTGVPSEYVLGRSGIDTSTINHMPRGAKAASQKIISMAKNWGDGAYGAMNVTWKGTQDAHVVMVVNQGGTIRIVDPQCGKSYTAIESYLKSTNANNTQLIRLDNAKVKDSWSSPTTQQSVSLDKMVKRRSTK